GGDAGLYLETRNAPAGSYHHFIPFIGIVATLMAAGVCWNSWKNGAKRVLWATGAWEVVEPANEDQRRLMNVVEEMAIAAGLPKPKVWVVPDSDPNAFATGIDPRGASIAVTEGLLRTLNREELQGVVAHEMSHVRNLDTRLMTLLAGMVGAIALMSDGLGRMFRGGVRVGGSRGSSGGGGKKDSSPLGLIVLVLWVFTLIIAPVMSRLLQMAVSRKREYLADATAAQLTRNPGALASALEKLAAASEPTRSITNGAAHLCIVDPASNKFSEREGVLGDIFASHPPIAQRVIRLKGMAYQQAKRESPPAAAAS
ncbi:MAG TPA: M48 family metallopeptidase, partial [Gemmatimonadales bacterium]|nr:M48 family metallopeptidase [Gemmatimonadales bacterium]